MRLTKDWRRRGRAALAALVTLALLAGFYGVEYHRIGTAAEAENSMRRVLDQEVTMGASVDAGNRRFFYYEPVYEAGEEEFGGGRDVCGLAVFERGLFGRYRLAEDIRSRAPFYLVWATEEERENHIVVFGSRAPEGAVSFRIYACEYGTDGTFKRGEAIFEAPVRSPYLEAVYLSGQELEGIDSLRSIAYYGRDGAEIDLKAAEKAAGFDSISWGRHPLYGRTAKVMMAAVTLIGLAVVYRCLRDRKAKG